MQSHIYIYIYFSIMGFYVKKFFLRLRSLRKFLIFSSDVLQDSHGILFNTLDWSIWEKNLKRIYIYIYNRYTLQQSRNKCNIVNYTLIKMFLKMKFYKAFYIQGYNPLLFWSLCMVTQFPVFPHEKQISPVLFPEKPFLLLICKTIHQIPSIHTGLFLYSWIKTTLSYYFYSFAMNLAIW